MGRQRTLNADTSWYPEMETSQTEFKGQVISSERYQGAPAKGFIEISEYAMREMINGVTYNWHKAPPYIVY